MKRRFAYLGIALILILVLVSYINNIFTEIKQYNISMQLRNEEALVHKLEASILERFSKSEQDVTFMATYLGQNLSEVGVPSELDAQVIETIMSDILPNFLTNPIYQEISFLDKNGNEVLIANKSNMWKEVQVNKEGENYFLGVIKHRAGEVHVTFDGNSVHIASPIYSDTKLFGAVILTLQKDNFLKELQAENKDDVMLIEDTGEYIMKSNSHQGQDFMADFTPDVFETIMTSSTGSIETEKGTLLTYIPLELDDHKWFLITQVDKGIITANTSVLQRQLTVILIVTFAIILGLLGLWSISHGKALKADQLRRDNAELANLNSLLRRKQNELEEQTAVVEELNAQLEDESRRYLRQKDMLQAIIDSIGSGLAMTDIAGRTIFMNKTWRRIFGYDQGNDNRLRTSTEGELTVHDIIRNVVTGAKNGEQVAAEIEEIQQDFKEYYRAELEYNDSKHRFCSITSLPCQTGDGQDLGRIFLFRDITRYKEVDLLKAELISTVSHELRTPMSSVMGFSELLLTRQLSPERSRQYVEIIYEQAERLTKLISDFLDIQRMESGKQAFEKQRLDFMGIVNRVLELFSNIEEKHQIVFECDSIEPLYVFGDQDKLLQVMSNLLSNAIKYSPQGGQITVKIIVIEEVLEVCVTDQGLGIPEEAQAQLFSKFFRVNNDDRREIGGTGLGLAICKEIVEGHNGKIRAESIYGEGSTFSFTLPLADSSEFKKNDLTSLEMKNSLNIKDKILIVEDDKNLVHLIETVLKEDGFTTYSVCKGEDALKLVGQADFKMIILDINLAGLLNGWDVVKALKDEERTANIPVIISSVYENTTDSEAIGISNFLVKPFKPKKLLSVVHKVMSENVEAKMLMHGDETPDENIVDILRFNGIKVKDLKRTDNILMITLEGEC